MTHWFNKAEQMNRCLETSEIHKLEAIAIRANAALVEAKAEARGEWLLSKLTRRCVIVEPEDGTTMAYMGGLKEAYISAFWYEDDTYEIILEGVEFPFYIDSCKLYDNGYFRLQRGNHHLNLNIKNWKEFLQESTF